MSVPFRLRQFDHVVLRVRDVAAMRRFYRFGPEGNMIELKGPPIPGTRIGAAP